MAREKKSKDRSQDRHRHSAIGLRPTDSVRAALVALAARERRSVAQMSLILLERQLRQMGLMPPADTQDGAGEQAAPPTES